VFGGERAQNNSAEGKGEKKKKKKKKTAHTTKSTKKSAIGKAKASAHSCLRSSDDDADEIALAGTRGDGVEAPRRRRVARSESAAAVVGGAAADSEDEVEEEEVEEEVGEDGATVLLSSDVAPTWCVSASSNDSLGN
jgi:hypothetical protein